MKLHIVFVTAGEWPAQKGLLVSQVLETAHALKTKGYTVSWVAAIPLFSRVKRWFLKDQDLEWLKSECMRAEIAFDYKIIPVTLGSPWSLPFRHFWHALFARYVMKRSVFGSKNRAIVLHARSYDAADIGLQLQRLFKTFETNRKLVTSFDMRSFLGPESPMSHGFLGTVAYGFIKEQEFELVRGSDVAFLPLNIGRRQYFEETGQAIRYAPIQGLAREEDWSVNFETRWLNRRIGYSGSVGQWHDPNLLRQIFGLFPSLKPQLACKMIDAFSGLDCVFYKQSDLPKYYDGLLALVIPGLAQVDTYYRTLQMRCNLFSTKAAEALSRGVPLIVSSELQELADFVYEHQCGIIINVSKGVPVLQSKFDLESREFWATITQNAVNVGKKFERSAVLEIYENAWKSALENKQEGLL